MESLIVDFPVHRRRPSIRADGCTKNRSKSVHFSPTVEIGFIATISTHNLDLKELWYTDQDYKVMKAANKKAICHLYNTFRSLSLSDLVSRLRETEDSDVCLMMGLERFVSNKIMKKSTTVKRECLRAVMGEQDRQYLGGEDDPQAIGMLAQRHSEWATKRAHTIGLLHSQQRIR